MVGIYLIENKITGECYIGQSKNIEARFNSHRNSAKNKKYALYTDMRYYGINAFEFSVLEKCSSNDLDKREMFWIRKFQEEGKSLYNIIGVFEKERSYVNKRYKKRFNKY